VLLITLSTAAVARGQSLEPAGTLAQGAGVRFTAISPDGRWLAAACGDRRVRLFSLPDGRTGPVLETGGAAGALSFSRDGRRLAVGGESGVARVFEAASGARVFESPAAKRGIGAIALSPDGGRLAMAPVEDAVLVYDLEGHRPIATIAASFAGAIGLAFSPDGRLLATANGDTSVRLFDAASARPICAFDGLDLEPFALDFTPDSKVLVVGGADRALVAIDTQTGTPRRRSPTQGDPIGGLTILADGRTVIAACFNADNMDEAKDLVAWDLETGRVKRLGGGVSFNGGGVAAGRALLTSTEGDALKLWAIR
jgi:WD40 repeat protein